MDKARGWVRRERGTRSCAQAEGGAAIVIDVDRADRLAAALRYCVGVYVCEAATVVGRAPAWVVLRRGSCSGVVRAPAWVVQREREERGDLLTFIVVGLNSAISSDGHLGLCGWQRRARAVQLWHTLWRGDGLGGKRTGRARHVRRSKVQRHSAAGEGTRSPPGWTSSDIPAETQGTAGQQSQWLESGEVR